MEKNKNKNEAFILLSHGDGGVKTGQLIENIILKYLKNDTLSKMEDSAKIDCLTKKLAYTTDSFVVNPIFFPGGDIGKLSICGTINDLATTGCIPCSLSFSLILEEGFAISEFEKILSSASDTLLGLSHKVNIVTGDTKVVEKGSVDKIFINTSGIGFIDESLDISPSRIREGDLIIINGSIAEHGIAVLGTRKEFNFKTKIKSDCAPLDGLVSDMVSASSGIHALRDATRGGLARVLIEMAQSSGFDFEINETKIPLKREVRGFCEFLGMDPLYIANEGKMISFVSEKDADKVLDIMKKNKYGKDSQVIGKVLPKKTGTVQLKTKIGTKRILDLHYSEQLPRIC